MKRKHATKNIIYNLFILTFILMFCLLITATFAQAASVDVIFAWDANTEPDLVGYRLYRSPVSQAYLFGDPNIYITIPAGVTQYTLMNYAYTITQYFVLTAYDAGGNESGPSNEVSYTLDTETPGVPQGFSITININVNP